MFAAILSLVQKIYNNLTSYTTSSTALLNLIESQTSTIAPGGSAIKSIQTGSFSAAVGETGGGYPGNGGGDSTGGSVSITSVNPAKAYVVCNGVQIGATGSNEFFFAAGSAYLTSATTVACSVSGAGYSGATATVYFTVVEFN
jgi:hypothetical protein